MIEIDFHPLFINQLDRLIILFKIYIFKNMSLLCQYNSIHLSESILLG